VDLVGFIIRIYHDARSSECRMSNWPPVFLCTLGNNYGDGRDNRKYREMGLKLLNQYTDCYNCLQACRVTRGDHTCVFSQFPSMYNINTVAVRAAEPRATLSTVS